MTQKFLCVPVVAAFLAGLCSGTAAFAHAVFKQPNAPADSYFTADLLIPHGCDGMPTTKIRVQIPDDIYIVRPEEKPGWVIEIVKKPLATPMPGPHGKMITDKITDIVWSGGVVADAHYQSFGLIVKTPMRPSGSKIAFPVIQSCDNGTQKGELRWVDAPDNKQGSPAPALIIMPKP